jgi:hypothetical protein
LTTGCDGNPLQREHDESEADQDLAEAPGGTRLRRQEQHDAREDQERRQPRQVERQQHGDERGADIRAEHDREGGCRADDPLARERRDDQCRCRAALDQSRHAEPGEERGRAVRYASAQHAAQVAAVHAQDARAHDVRAPDEERYAGQQVQECLQGPTRAANTS